jgi:hypothetical protein
MDSTGAFFRVESAGVDEANRFFLLKEAFSRPSRQIL